MEHKILARYPLGNPHRLWQQDNFILSNFAARANNMRNAIRNCKEAGFNLVEMGWASPEQATEAVRYCEQYELDVIFQDLKRYGGMQGNRFYEKNDLEGVINDLRKWKRVAGFYIWDEPYIDDQLEEARMLMDICEREAPDKLPFTVAIPSYNDRFQWGNDKFPEYLEKYINVIDPPVLSLDYYPVGMGEHNEEVQFDRTRMWCDLALMKKLAEKYNMPLWFYYQGQNLHNVEFFIFPMVRCMMYAGVLYGAKGLQHYTAVGAVLNHAGDKGKFFEDQKAIHEEFKNLGETLMALTCLRIFHDKTVDPLHKSFEELHNKISESAYLTQELPVRVAASEFEDAYGNGYMMVLNRDYMAEKTVTLPLNGNYRIYEVSKTDGLQKVIADCTDKLELTLAAGDATLLRLQKAEEEAFTVEYRLEK